jgi:hypothetical protein
MWENYISFLVEQDSLIHNQLKLFFQSFYLNEKIEKITKTNQ